MSYLRALPVRTDDDQYGVESIRTRNQSLFPKVDFRGSRQPIQFLRSDTFLGKDSVIFSIGRPGFHFDENELIAVFGDDIHLAECPTAIVPIIPIKYPISERTEKCHRRIFSAVSDHTFRMKTP